MGSESVGSSNPLLELNNSLNQQVNGNPRSSPPVHLLNIDRDICYYCKKQGHWAINCPEKTNKLSSPDEVRRNSNGMITDGNDESFPGRKCPCGAGSCLVVTSHTEKNPGRKFYKCPAKFDKKCNFFQWCDMASDEDLSDVAQIPPYPMCPCGAGMCSRFIVKKEGITKGRPFFTCPLKKGEGACKFFEWQDMIATKILGSGLPDGSRLSPKLRFDGQEEPKRTIYDVKNNNEFEGVESPLLMGEGSRSPLIKECQVKEEMVKLDSMLCDDIISPIRNLKLGEDKVTLALANQRLTESSYPSCPCGAGSCTRFTEESGENKGRSFFICPIKKGEGACNFFQRDDTAPNKEEDTKHKDHKKLLNPVSPVLKEEWSESSLTREYHIKEEMVRLDSDTMIYNDTVSPMRNFILKEEMSKSGQCLWCGNEGHWSNECITSNPFCFRCGKIGHWMKYCTA